MIATDLMTAEVLTCSPQSSVLAARAIMIDGGVSQLVVVDDDEVVGMVSDRDFRDILPSVSAWAKSDEAENAELDDFVRSLSIEHIMSHPPIVVSASLPAQTVAAILLRNRISAVPVVEGGLLLGIISRSDILNSVAYGQPTKPYAQESSSMQSSQRHCCTWLSSKLATI